MRILIVEDEMDIVQFLKLELEHEGYSTAYALDGREGLSMAENESFDLILLDISLPSLNGIEVLRRLRQTKDVPVILLTARDTVMDKITGLDMGANDYMTKPFYIEELFARIRANTRTQPEKDETKKVLRVLDLELNPASHTVTRAGTEIPLTKKEYDLLAHLMENRNVVLTREQLLSVVWGYDFEGESNIVDVYISYLRSKLNKGYAEQHIETVRGVGFVLKGK